MSIEMSLSATSHETTTIPEAMIAVAEIDSDGSSCGERDARKRVRGDVDPAGPKKRRKQSTPVRLSSSLANEDGREDEREDEDSEGKQSSRSPLPSNDYQHHDHHHHYHHHHHRHQHPPSSKDENLNNEFRCQHCGRLFDSKETLNVHVNGEHGVANQAASSISIKLEPAQQLDQTEGPVNLLSVKNFATTWLAAGSQHVQSQTQVQPQIQSQGEDSWPGSVNPITTMNNHLQAFTNFPGALAQYLPLSGFPLADPQQIPRSSLGPAPIRIFNPDAYCDLCNKEFCNKYFLKTHKANKHRIYTDLLPSSSSAVDAANATGVVFGVNFHNNAATIKLEPPVTPPTTGVACDVCQKRFRNEESVRKHKQKVHNESTDQTDQQISLSQNEEDRETPRDSPGGMESALFKQEYGVEQEDTSFMPAPRHLSPQSIQQARDSGFSADRLRRLGVINPEAFCEICCKEYCNKYFLRTHKMKRHGIVVQDNEKSPGNPGSTATWHQVQTSPLNLIVNESTVSSESNDRIGEEYECKPCGIRFQTVGLHQAHCRNMHEGEEAARGTPKPEYEPDGVDQRNDSISEDLQKLQTMILQLNGLEPGKASYCAVCGKECDSRSALRVHMATEHGTASDETPSSPREKSPVAVSTIFCTLCEKDYPSQEALRRHINEEHQPIVSGTVVLPAIPAITTASTANSTTTTNQAGHTTPQTTTEKKLTSLTPTSSYCEICNKELCNKYFMKTHMQRMHGIEIENGAQIGGVICNICNKELCSKYFLRVHKHNTHGIVDESTTTGSMNNKQEASYDTSSAEDTSLKPEQLSDLSHRYFTHFTEVCPICSRRFRSIKWLKAHLMGDHGKQGIDKWREMEQQYQTTPRSGGRSASSAKTTQQTSNLKIPNGFEVAQQIKSTDYTNLGNQVLSNLFGSSEEHLKNYRCSYCNFATPVLPFLFLHERSHVNSQENLETDRSLQCPICSQEFHQLELLHQHLLAKHQAPTLLSQFQQPAPNNDRVDVEAKPNDVKDRDDLEKNDRVARSPQRAPQSVCETAKNQQRQDETAVQVTPQGAYKCAQCGYATTNLNRIKKHVRKDHKTIGDPTESVIAELSKTLKEVANKQKVPACYAMPQDMNSNPDKTIMQPFLIEEQDLMQAGVESSSAKRFVPALVYLPVKSRIGNALTASFTLTPA